MQMEKELKYEERSIGWSRCCISLAARIAHGACSASGAPSTVEHRCSASTLPAVAPATAVQFLTCFGV